MKAYHLDVDYNRPIDIIAMGRVAVDLYAEQIGAELKDVQTFRKYLGGCAGNIAVGCARLSLKASMLSCVGADAMGQFLLSTLKKEGVDTQAVQISEKHLTGLVMLGVCPPHHFPLIFFRNDCADMAIDPHLITNDYLGQAKVLLITGTHLSNPRSKAATFHAIKLAKANHTKIILDIDYRPVLWGLLSVGDGENRYVPSPEVSQTLSLVLPLVDLIVGTIEECQIAGRQPELKNALASIRQQTKAFIVVKQGVDGAACYFENLSSPLISPSFPIKVLNVLGAGDAFMAGLLSCLLTGKDFKEALTTANACGAIVVSRHGCAPAMPSAAELSYFLSQYQDDHEVLLKPKINVLHQQTILQQKDRQPPMPILAFCHRWQLEEVCHQFNKPLSHISLFKEALAKAAVKVKNITNAYLLLDPIYGESAIEVGQKANLGIIVAIEKSGQKLTEWFSPLSPYEILLKRPASFGVKVLWQFHGDLNASEQSHQLARLNELSQACFALERKLMLELILRPEFNQNDDELLKAITRVYQQGITPYWWKLPSFSSEQSFKKLGAVIDEFDEHARVLILGGEAKDLNEYQPFFSMAKSTPHSIGFAVGRSIFWPSFIAFMKDECSLKDVTNQVSEAFLKLYQIWIKS